MGFVGLEEIEDGCDGDFEVLCDVVWVGVGVEEKAAEGGAGFGGEGLGRWGCDGADGDGNGVGAPVGRVIARSVLGWVECEHGVAFDEAEKCGPL